MTIDITVDKGPFRITCLLVTNTLETHSAIQEIPKNRVHVIKQDIQNSIKELLEEAEKHKKTP